MWEYGFHWSTILSLYGKIQVSDNSYSRIFYAVRHQMIFLNDDSTNWQHVRASVLQVSQCYDLYFSLIYFNDFHKPYTKLTMSYIL